MAQPPNTRHYRVRVITTKDVDVYIPEELTTEQAFTDWRRGLWHIDGAEDIAKHAATMAAQSGSGTSHDGIGRIGTDIDAEYADPDSPIDLVFSIGNDDDETEILIRPEEPAA